METKNIEIAFKDKSIIASGYSHNIDLPTRTTPTEADLTRAKRLCRLSGGHNNFLNGIRINFDLKYEQYFTIQAQRYNFLDFVNSESKMVKLVARNDILPSCNEFVLSEVAEIINTMLHAYNTHDFKLNNFFIFGKIIKTKKELFRYIISNLPMGFQLWASISTNYLQLRNIYFQRKNHKLPEWREFAKFIESLEDSWLITSK